MRYTPIKIANNTNCWQRLEQLELLLLMGVCNYIVTVENSFIISYRTKLTFTMWPSNSTPMHFPRRNGNTGPQKYLNNNVHNHFVIVTPNWKQSTCPWRGKWINKVWQIHTVEYNSALKGKKTPNDTCGWISKTLRWVKEGIHRREHTVWFPLYETLEKTNLI